MGVGDLFALRFRTPVVPRRAVDALAWLLQPLSLPPVVLASLVALVAMDPSAPAAWAGRRSRP